MDITHISSLPEKSQRDLPRVINRLLGQAFLYQDKDEYKDDYYFIHRHRAACETTLELTGFKLLHDEYHRIFQAISEYSYCRARYKLDETLMILVLRKLYEEHTERLSLGQYETLLRRLRTIGLIETLDGRSIDVRDAEARLRLRGSVRMILPIQTVDELDAWFRKYRTGSEEEVEESV